MGSTYRDYHKGILGIGKIRVLKIKIGKQGVDALRDTQDMGP